MLVCEKCKQQERDEEANFCKGCGTAFKKEKELPFIGVSANKGIFQITFPTQEAEFSSEDGAREAVRHSAWNEDREFEGKVHVKFVRSTVTAKTHPYECRDCKDTVNAIVAESTVGRCSNCGNSNWQKRQK